ncbi:hypothetical protein FR483_n442R [Paramecium bursaria Chlorella virus FR483]|uniref:Uncharacterized protein n442R n=1 Tax=Paramecium bursaria Chlorella virus FR483 TaxID=399781 RepID=A7J7E6_PBCVF|nr:hypothetical protein FR483_n442R [Paramecium bursaria Chlorella virus FR483]ABT15727.1 hypothetical protein FR483_n442R [Paramecium bursaria Chlorella virus FR483]
MRFKLYARIFLRVVSLWLFLESTVPYFSTLILFLLGHKLTNPVELAQNGMRFAKSRSSKTSLSDIEFEILTTSSMSRMLFK